MQKSGRSERYGFPKLDGYSLSHWLQGVQGDELLGHRSTPEIPQSADIVIIGSGLTGTVVARSCLETWPEKTIVVLEAREFCSGATGRNAGHCKPDQFRGFKKYEKDFGSNEAIQILETEHRTWTDLVRYIRENDVDCDLWIGDTMDVPMTPKVADTTKDIFESFKLAGGDVSRIKVTYDPVEASRISRIKDAQSCYAWPASTLQPWKLTAHIMRDNLKKGLNLQTRTTVINVKQSIKSPPKWIVQTDRGNIEASQVVHATNAYSSALEPSLRGLISPSPHICNRIVPTPEFAGTKRLRNSYGVLMPNGNMFSINPRSTSDGFLMFGGSNPGQREFAQWLDEHPERCVDDSLLNFESISNAIEKFTESEFQSWDHHSDRKKHHYEDGWSGIIGWSSDGLPFVGQLPGLPGQWVCAGHNGHGMARIFTAAPGLVKLMAGYDWDATQLPESFQITSQRIEKLRRKTSRKDANDIIAIDSTSHISIKICNRP